MIPKVSPETALEFTKISVLLMFTWPPWPEESRLVKILFNVFPWIFLGLPLLLVILLLNAARYQLDDHLGFTKNICLAASCSHAVVKQFVCKRQRSRLEVNFPYSKIKLN